MQSLLPVTHNAASDWRLATQIRCGDPHAVEELYRMMKQMLRPTVLYSVRETDPHDLLHETLTIVVENVQNGNLRNPGALRAYVQAVIRRQVATRIIRAVWDRKRMVDAVAVIEMATSGDDPEKRLLKDEKRELLKRGISRLGSRDNELLTRFYLRGEKYGHICEEMNLTETQFRLFKSRAKARLTAWAREAMAAVQSVGRAGGGTKAP
jgi:RNA polymerase sigma factor (sigma-70 family)